MSGVLDLKTKCSGAFDLNQNQVYEFDLPQHVELVRIS